LFLLSVKAVQVGLRAMRWSILSVASVIAAICTGGAGADPVSADRSSPFARVYGPTLPPFGFVQFCEAWPNECAVSGGADQRFQATPERLSELDEINRLVNKAIQPATDLEIYGVSELWTLPRDKGDCEDYALLKRHLLMQRGWPASALLMTVVRDEQGEGHAVLTARTAQGDFILDNKVDAVKLWYLTPYQFVMRQSFINPKAWVSLDPQANSPVSIAGVRSRR
jgi:predicted transglutaminase-like cysteine proteinase